jgi:hypothetical protein
MAVPMSPPWDPQHGNLSGIFNTVPQLGPSVIFNTVFCIGSSTRFFPGIPTWHPIYYFPSWYLIHWGSPRILNTMSHLRFSLKPDWRPQHAVSHLYPQHCIPPGIVSTVSHLGYSTLCPSWYRQQCVPPRILNTVSSWYCQHCVPPWMLVLCPSCYNQHCVPPGISILYPTGISTVPRLRSWNPCPTGKTNV